jgi:predicted regulator of Ras-like GTPase activity (Roadblock/LC7/MglB family)
MLAPRNPRTDRYREALEWLFGSVPALSGAVLLCTDGFEVASVSTCSLPVSRLSAIASSLMALGQASLHELGLAGGGTVLIEGIDGRLLLLEVPSPAQPMVLALTGGADSVPGSMLWAARECVQRIVVIST